MNSSIQGFVDDLAKSATTDGLWNMYSHLDTSLEPMYAPARRQQVLTMYLEGRQKQPYALVGLAPGYAGARFSGEPFNDEAHVFSEHGIRLSKRIKPWQEETATVVQKAIQRLALHHDIVCWNALPWHPYRKGTPLANRTPDWREVETYGLPWLGRFLELMEPGTVIPVGRIAERAVSALGITNAAPYVRHPSHGGAELFFRGLHTIVNGSNAEEDKLREAGGRSTARGRQAAGIPEGSVP